MAGRVGLRLRGAAWSAPGHLFARRAARACRPLHANKAPRRAAAALRPAAGRGCAAAVARFSVAALGHASDALHPSLYALEIPRRPSAAAPGDSTAVVDSSHTREPQKVGYILHGLLGTHKNWVNYAKLLAKTFPGWRFVIPDLRNHGRSHGFAGPHSLSACARDVMDLFSVYGTPTAVIGHSLGGKVALQLVEELGADASGLTLWVLDSIPGEVPTSVVSGQEQPADSVGKVLEFVRNLPQPIESRKWLAAAVASQGFPDSIAAWLSSNLVQHAAGHHGERSGLFWAFESGTAAELLHDYAATDLWHVLDAAAAGVIDVAINFVLAEKSVRWQHPDLAARIETFQRIDGLAEGGRLHIHRVADSAHWIHVDNPFGLLRAIEQAGLDWRLTRSSL